MKRIATLLAVLTLTAIAGSALADAAPINCSPTNASTCGCTASPAGNTQATKSLSDILKMSDQYLP